MYYYRLQAWFNPKNQQIYMHHMLHVTAKAADTDQEKFK